MVGLEVILWNSYGWWGREPEGGQPAQSLWGSWVERCAAEVQSSGTLGDGSSELLPARAKGAGVLICPLHLPGITPQYSLPALLGRAQFCSLTVERAGSKTIPRAGSHGPGGEGRWLVPDGVLAWP